MNRRWGGGNERTPVTDKNRLSRGQRNHVPLRLPINLVRRRPKHPRKLHRRLSSATHQRRPANNHHRRRCRWRCPPAHRCPHCSHHQSADRDVHDQLWPGSDYRDGDCSGYGPGSDGGHRDGIGLWRGYCWCERDVGSWVEDRVGIHCGRCCCRRLVLLTRTLRMMM